VTRRPPIRALIFDAGHTLLEMDYARFTAHLLSRGHDVDQQRVMDAERRARMRLDVERSAAGSRQRTGEGRYVRYLAADLGITDDAEHAAIAAWRRGFNVPIGLCHQADGAAASAIARACELGLIVGVISNSNGSVRMALERAGLAERLAFVIDSSVVGVAKPDPRIFALGLEAAGVSAAEAVYVGDSYFVDVVAARTAGLGAVLFDPGRVWGQPAGLTVTRLDEAVDRAVAGGATGD
jgi:putative hydrolase of the HAD superfamily